MITIAEQARARVAAEKAIKSGAVTKNSNGTYTINSGSKAGTTIGTSSSGGSGGGGGGSAKNLTGYNFVDPSVLQDAQVNGLSKAEMDAKWGQGTSQNLNTYYQTYGSSSSAKSMPTLTTAKALPANTSWDKGPGYYAYSNKTGYYEKVSNPKGLTYQEDDDYYGMLYDKDKFTPDATYEWDADPDWLTSALNDNGQYGQNVDTNIDLTGGEKNTNMNSFGAAVNNKLQTAFGIQNMAQLKEMYPEQYSSLVQSLNAVAGTWNALDPSQRQLLDGQLQAIIGTAVGAGSDTSKLNVLNESMMNKFEDGERVAQDMKDIINLQTKGMSTEQIADRMGISEDQVQQAVLAYNGLDNRLGEYYKLKEGEANEITEDFDKQRERLEEEKRIQLERANRQIEWLKEDFDKNLDRQKKANEINEHNADFLAGQYGFGFSKRGMEGLNYVTDQAKQIIDDMVTNYDRTNQEMADGVADILRNWEWNNEDLLKASEDALTQAKNNYTSNMLMIQQQYGTVGMQAQQQLANNVQNFITTAENIYDNALNRQQQNLSNLITNFSNLNALQYSNLTLRNAKIQQFQSEAMTLNRSQLQSLADQLGMSPQEFQDLATYQVQAVANELNGYAPGAGLQFQNQIASLLNQGYTPAQVMQNIMGSSEFKNMQSVSGEWTKLNDSTLFDKNTGKTITVGGNANSNYVTSEMVNGQTYGVSEQTYNTLLSFYNSHQEGSQGGQCGKFVNDYLESLGVGRIFTDPITDKKAQINTPEGYKPQIGDVVVMDSPSQPQYGHTAIITGVNSDGTFTTLESNKKGEEQVFSRTIDPSKTKVYGYYHPDGAVSGGGASGPVTDYGVPISYDRSIKAMIPTQLMNSELELNKLESNISSLYKAGYSAEDAVLQYMGFNINKEEDKDMAISLVNAVRSLTNEDSVQSAVSYISQKINAGDYNSAIKKVENLVREEAKKNEGSGYFDESTARMLVEKSNALINLANSLPQDIGIFEGTFQKYLKKLKSSDASKLQTAIAYLTDEQVLRQAGSNMTESELQRIKTRVPQIDERADTFMNKVEQLKQNALTNLNAWRQTYGLPVLDEQTLLNSNSRVDLYNGSYTQGSQGRGLQGTIDITNRSR